MDEEGAEERWMERDESTCKVSCFDILQSDELLVFPVADVCVTFLGDGVTKYAIYERVGDPCFLSLHSVDVSCTRRDNVCY